MGKVGWSLGNRRAAKFKGTNNGGAPRRRKMAMWLQQTLDRPNLLTAMLLQEGRRMEEGYD